MTVVQNPFKISSLVGRTVEVNAEFNQNRQSWSHTLGVHFYSTEEPRRQAVVFTVVIVIKRS